MIFSTKPVCDVSRPTFAVNRQMLRFAPLQELFDINIDFFHRNARGGFIPNGLFGLSQPRFVSLLQMVTILGVLTKPLPLFGAIPSHAHCWFVSHLFHEGSKSNFVSNFRNFLRVMTSKRVFYNT
ncbi:hypothetical protein BH20ACI2_BH20ACI2_05950 [soil metagenome]